MRLSKGSVSPDSVASVNVKCTGPEYGTLPWPGTVGTIDCESPHFTTIQYRSIGPSVSTP